MLYTYLMVGVNDGPLEEVPGTFDVGRVNVAKHPLFRAVVDAAALSVGVSASVVARIVIPVNSNCVSVGRFRHEAAEHFGIPALAALLDRRVHAAATLQYSENYSLVAGVRRDDACLRHKFRPF